MKLSTIIGLVLFVVLFIAGAAKFFGETLNVDGAKRALREWGVLVSETEKAISEVENDIKTLRAMEQSNSTNLWKLQSQLLRNAETKKQTAEQIEAKKILLKNLDAALTEHRPLVDRFSKKQMTTEEIDAYISRIAVELAALNDLLGELIRQDELVQGQLTKYQQQAGTIPTRLLELTSGLELLRMQFRFNKEYLTQLKQNGVITDADTVYHNAKSKLRETLDSLGCATPIPMPEPDLDTATASATDRCEIQRQRINTLLGTTAEPIVK